MSHTSAVVGAPAPTTARREPTVRSLVLVSLVFLAVQTSLADYGSSNPDAGGFWFLLGCLLLWLVYRKRSRVARGVLVVSALVGAVIYASVAVGDPFAVLLVVAYLGQALPLLAGPVRRHVHGTD